MNTQDRSRFARWSGLALACYGAGLVLLLAWLLLVLPAIIFVWGRWAAGVMGWL